MAAVSDREEPPVRLQGLTGYRYLLAVLVLVALATVPMLLAIAAGRAALDRTPTPAVEPFLSPDEAGGVGGAEPGGRDDLADPDRSAQPGRERSAGDFAGHELIATAGGGPGGGDVRAGGGRGDTGWWAPGGSRMLW